jgi:hypothetical protein
MPSKSTHRVYFVLAKSLDMVKIGYSTTHPDSRLAGIRTGCPVEIERLAVIPGGRALELALHKRFETYRVCGEWFRYAPEIQAFVSKQCQVWTPRPPKVKKTLTRKTIDRVCRKCEAEFRTGDGDKFCPACRKMLRAEMQWSGYLSPAPQRRPPSEGPGQWDESENPSWENAVKAIEG